MGLVEEIGIKYENLPGILARYTRDLEDATERLSMKGKLLETCNSENSAWLHYYDQRRVEMHTLVKYFTTEELRIKSELFKTYKEGYSRALGEREINRYIESETTYLYAHSLLIEVEEMYELYQCVVTAFTSRNYALSNITKLRVSSLEHTEI